MFLDAFELGNSPDLAFAGPFTIEGGVGGALPSSNTTSSTGGSSSSPSTGAVPAAPAGGNSGATPAAPSASSNGNSQTSAHNPTATQASAANKQVVGQAVVALGMAAAVVSQFF